MLKWLEQIEKFNGENGTDVEFLEFMNNAIEFLNTQKYENIEHIFKNLQKFLNSAENKYILKLSYQILSKCTNNIKDNYDFNKINEDLQDKEILKYAILFVQQHSELKSFEKTIKDDFIDQDQWYSDDLLEFVHNNPEAVKDLLNSTDLKHLYKQLIFMEVLNTNAMKLVTEKQVEYFKDLECSSTKMISLCAKRILYLLTNDTSKETNNQTVIFDYFFKEGSSGQIEDCVEW